jgi:hypothetical protein
MDLWKLWPTIQTEERISMSYEQKAPSKLTEAQKEMVRNVREMDKKNKRTLICLICLMIVEL